MIHCPSCGAGLRFEIETQKMVCDHCDSRFPVEELSDRSSNDAKAAELFDTYIYVCPDCGAELASTEKNDMIGFCPYCGGAHMLYDRVRENWKPDYVIPFKVTKEQCKEAYLQEVRRHPFVSSGYRKPKLIESFRGIYMPFWYFEGEQNCDYVVREKTVEMIGNTPRRKYYDQYYTLDYKLEGYAHDASVNFDDHISEKLAPYTYEEKKEFHPAYLSGFYAETGDATRGEYYDLAVAKMQDVTSDEISRLCGKKTHLEIPTEVESLECALHPVWFMSYRKKNRITYAAVNGETGKVAADLPLSPLRILLAALFCSAAVFGLIWLLMSLLPSVTAATTLGVCAVIMSGGVTILFASYLNTVEQSLRLRIDKHSSSMAFFFISYLALLLGYLLVATDGSYSQVRSGLGILILIISLPMSFFAGPLLPQTDLSVIMKASRRTTGSRLENGIMDTAQRYKAAFRTLLNVSYIIMLFCFINSIGDFFGKTTCYILCGVTGLYLLATALLHIRFQKKIATRRPPQMNKKGAMYDEK